MRYLSSFINSFLRAIQKRQAGKLILIVSFVCYINGIQLVNAQWSPNNALTIVSGGQHPGIISDQSGGAIIAWYTGSAVGAKRVDANGVQQWSTTIGSGFGQQVPVSIISDGNGGAILTWIGSGVIVQKVNASGALQWGSGVTVCSVSNGSFDPALVSDGAGGAIIVWEDSRNAAISSMSIYAQRVNSSGVEQWASSGVAICNTYIGTSNGIGPDIVSDQSNGAIISWQDTRNGNNDIYAQRIDGVGGILWAANGIPVCNLTSSQSEPDMIGDTQGGTIITWTDNRNGNNDIYAQRINSFGIAQWTTDGIGVCIWGGTDFSSMIVNDDNGGAVVGWIRNNGLYAQKVNASGILQWQSGPVTLTTVNSVSAPNMTSDGAGGAIIAWMDFRNSQYDIYAQRILSAGIVPWTANGVAVSTTVGLQKGYPVVANNALQGVIVSWNTSGFPSQVTYAQNVNDDGTIGLAAMLEAICPGGSTTLTSDITGASYQWQVNTGSGFVNISNNSNYSGTNAAVLQLNNIPSGWYGYTYRCVVNGLYSLSFRLRVSDKWIGGYSNNWEDPANWICGTVPDANTDVFIYSSNVIVNVNTTVRTLTLYPGGNLTVTPGVTLTVIHP